MGGTGTSSMSSGSWGLELVRRFIEYSDIIIVIIF
jgi:hypothetical protein